MLTSTLTLTLYVRFGGVEGVKPDNEGAVRHVNALLQRRSGYQYRAEPAAEGIQVLVPGRAMGRESTPMRDELI